ncbi:MAG: RNA polymerase sigma-54 factor RpoN [uncultured Acidimicrobiales bacterium]|uniref:RNA polymerase sigma-54 factor RpoN n=1 Tax=uncultured Acidimicrobiales bacterium TaxID=310071 RepID=A0A6J4IZH6_9ACTN|nr:MAG: RNA polymerase sigma-54 factor RpoN [uncultured Acidimicrobiales bacterium]
MPARRRTEEQSDEELARAAQDGDRDALEALLARHVDRIHAICRRIAGNDADGADATQEALVAVVRGINRFDGRSRFSTWAHRVATNACLDELRRRKRRPEPTADDDPLWERRPSAASDLADRVDLDAALGRLPLDFRTAVVLRDVTGLDYAEIAEILQIPVGTVRSRIARGRAALVPLLQGNPDATTERPNR